jgi:hypothetical protein
MSPQRRAYTIKQVCEVLAIPRRSFFHLRRTGQMPMLQELRPRIGRIVRYRADLVDLYADGRWGQPRSFASPRKLAS